MSDAALQNNKITLVREQVLDRLRLRDRVFHFTTIAAALIVLAILAGVIIALFIGRSILEAISIVPAKLLVTTTCRRAPR